jgi:osmotically inducible protein OsmC
MAKRKASATWKGTLKEGTGSVALGSGAFQGAYSFQSRFESGQGTNPEELIGGALAACFSMALAHDLDEAGYTPEKIETTAHVSFDPVGEGFKITTILLETQGTVPDVEEKVFIEHAEKASKNCPAAQALAAAEISVKARVQSS